MKIKKEISLLGIFCSLQVIVCFTISILRFETYRGGGDLAVFDQVFFSLKNSLVPLTTIAPPYIELNWLGWHFSPVLYLLLPFYWLISSPYTLQFMQCLLISVAAFPVFLSARAINCTEKTSLLLALVFLFNPAVINASIWDFHEICIAVPLMATGLLAVLKKNRTLFLLTMLLLICTKEHYGIAVAGFGILWTLWNKEKLFGAITAIAGIALFYLIVFHLMPALSGLPAHPMLGGVVAGEENDRFSRFKWVSESAGISERIAELLLTGKINGISYLFSLFLPVLFFPLAQPFLLLPAAADILVNTISLSPIHRSLSAYYSAPVMPAAIVASGWVICRLKLRNMTMLTSVSLSLLAIMPVIIFTGIPLSNPLVLWQLGENKEFIDSIEIEKISRLTGDNSVSVQPNLLVHFSQRRYVYPFPYGIENSRMAILSLYHPYQRAGDNPFAASYHIMPSKHFGKTMELLKSGYGVIYWNNNYLVLEKDTEDKVEGREVIIKTLEQLSVRH